MSTAACYGETLLRPTLYSAIAGTRHSAEFRECRERTRDVIYRIRKSNVRIPYVPYMYRSYCRDNYNAAGGGNARASAASAPFILCHSSVFDKERRADCNLDTTRRGL